MKTVNDYKAIAARKLPLFLYEYIKGGAYYEETLDRNIRDIKNIELCQNVLRDVSNVSMETELFGDTWSSPFGLGPVGLSGLYYRRGEIQAALAAEELNIPFCLSTLSVCSLEEVRSFLKKPIWFQLYMIKDRGFIKELLGRAKDLGCNVLVFTVDMPVPATRYRDYRTGLSNGSGISSSMKRFFQTLRRPGWLYNVGINGRPHNFGNLSSILGKKSSMEDCVRWISENFDPSVTWNDIEWIRDQWQGNLIIKGILSPDDAGLALKSGTDGIVVSNHGGRQLDGTSSSARALIPIVDKLEDKLPIMVDGGIRSGIDVVKLLAIGAKATLLGRSWAYALAAEGNAGVKNMINTFNDELSACMALSGCSDVKNLDRNYINLDYL